MSWLLKLATGNPITLLWIAGAVFVAGLGIGGSGAWTVQGYRMDAKVGPLKSKISQLQARESILENANGQCTKDVEAANQATDKLLAGQKAREAKSAADLRAAQAASAGFKVALDQLRAIKPPADRSCLAQSDAARALIADEIRGRK